MAGSQFSPQRFARNTAPDERCVASSQTESTRSAEAPSQIAPSPDDPQSLIVPQRGSIAAFLTSLREEVQTGDSADRIAPSLGNCESAACKPGTRPAETTPLRGLMPRIGGQPAGVEIWENPLRKASAYDFGALFTRAGQRNLVVEKKAEGTIHRDIDSLEVAPMPNAAPVPTAASAPPVAGANAVRPLLDLTKTTHFNTAVKDPSVHSCSGWAVASSDVGPTAKNYADAAVHFENGLSGGFAVPCTFGSEPAVGQYKFGWGTSTRP